MGCAEIALPNGDRAVLCGGRSIKACVGCGRLGTRLCDFKVVHRGVSRNGRSWQRKGTCSASICDRCTTRLPGDKDACPQHAVICLEACKREGLEVPA